MKIPRLSQAAHNPRFVYEHIYPPLGNAQDDSRMSDALAGLRTEIPTQETGPLPALSDGPQVDEARPAPGRYLATEERGELVLYALGEREGQSLHIGRSPASDIQLEDQSVSRRHAVVAHRGGRAVLLDDRSLNGIYVNGSRVGEAVLTDGDLIAIGHVSLRYVEVTGG
jgi:pSer/pThr/pTyr-binding forkhead associated (FHA) protein